ncbi:tRNA (uridine(34)/cytosine(34)/5-carboxymethylaminomethyluridine(34)-2'-O)-methyltransferase TrmL [Nitrospira defluvii]|nr:tRNA (uridine(34)/cytosine(34)/5-carboxymethylaminomethyluridine(34)-2'-O)-methyltransferase TrmL [Nitrospira defluvii]
MFHVVLYQPKIPPNTGNIIRLCANTGAQLHLIEPLGFSLDNTKLRRAGLDYREFVPVQAYPSLETFLSSVQPSGLFACSKFGRNDYNQVNYKSGDALLFGSETEGLPLALRDRLLEEQLLRIPMIPGNRSLNLSNAVAVILYEAWRQNRYRGSKSIEEG